MLKSIVSTVVLLMMVAIEVHAQTQIVSLSTSSISLATTKDQAQVPYYLVAIPRISAPQGSTLDEAWIEFYMDVSSTEPDSLTGGAVTLEVYRYTGLSNGKLDVGALEKSAMKRTVRIGDNQKIRVYVRDLCDHIIADGATDTQLIIGMVRGDRSGRFDSKSVPGAPAGAKALLTLQYSRLETESRVIR
jgi:hypothetical protein